MLSRGLSSVIQKIPGGFENFTKKELIREPGLEGLSMRDSEGFYSRPSLPVQVIDEEQAKSEIPHLRRLNQQLTSELFQCCCEIERDSSALDPERLSILVVSLEMVSKRLRRLEHWFGRG